MFDFNDITLKMYKYVHSLSSPLPNIIMLGDFNFPGMNWSTPHDSCPTAAPLISLTDSLFVNQQVNEPTCLMFGPDDLFKSITVTKSYISDHSIILTETSLPICTKSSIEFNPATSGFDKLDFNKANCMGRPTCCPQIIFLHYRRRIFIYRSYRCYYF